MKTLFEKTYHGFEDFADFWRDMEEAVQPEFNPEMNDIPDDFQGSIKVLITYEE